MDNPYAGIQKILKRRSFYRATFQSDAGREVLADLKRFCSGSAPTISVGSDGHIDPLASIARAARQEVFLRIIGHLHIDDAELTKLKERAIENDN